jgi:hypothetical protein
MNIRLDLWERVSEEDKGGLRYFSYRDEWNIETW